MESVQSLHFDASLLKEKQRYEAFQESMSVVYQTHAPTVQGSFKGSIHSHLIDELMLVEVEANEQTFIRDRSKIASDGLDHYMVQVYRYGHTRRTDSDRETVGNARSLIVYDASEPWESRTSDISNVTLVIPRALIQGKLLEDSGHHATIFSTQRPLANLLQETLLSYPTAINNGCTPEISVQSCVDLLALLLNEQSSNTSANKDDQEQIVEAYSRVLAIRIKRFIGQQLSSPSCGVTEICNAFNLSRAHLYRMFADEHGVAHYIKERRLSRAAQLLTYPGAQVFDVARQCGFTSSSTFRRAYKKRFGISPRDMLQAHREEKQHHSQIDDGQSWQQWFLALRDTQESER